MQPSNPFVSVIIPAYNQAEFLREAIQSVLSQSYENYEIIVVDDGSTDDTALIASQFADRIRYIHQDNQGLAGARNTGIYTAQGEFIGLLDADDQWRPNYLEEMLKLTASYPDASVYYCEAQGMDVNGLDLPQTFGSSRLLRKYSIYQILLRSNFIIPSTVLMRRISILTAGLFDQNLRSFEDWDLWFRLLPEHKFIGSDTCLVRYRVHEKSLTANLDGMFRANRSAREKHFGSEDGDPKYWTIEKRQSYGALYRNFAITIIQRLGDWQRGAHYLLKALEIDPTLAADFDMFYEIALGSQPAGYRGSGEKLTLEDNGTMLMSLLDTVFQADHRGVLSLKHQSYGTACYAVGLCAYHTYHFALSRQYFQRAGRYRPALLYSSNLTATWFKSWLGTRFLAKIQRRNGHEKYLQ